MGRYTRVRKLVLRTGTAVFHGKGVLHTLEGSGTVMEDSSPTFDTAGKTVPITDDTLLFLLLKLRSLVAAKATVVDRVVTAASSSTQRVCWNLEKNIVNARSD